jgi:hypothetical protein
MHVPGGPALTRHGLQVRAVLLHAQVGHLNSSQSNRWAVLQMLAPGAHLMHGLVVQPILALVDPQTLGPVVHVTQDPVGHVIRVQAEDGTVRPYVDKKELNT